MAPFLVREEEEALPLLTGRFLAAAPPRGDVLNDNVDGGGCADDVVRQGRRIPAPFNCEGEAEVVPMEAIAMNIVMAIIACRREVMVSTACWISYRRG